MRKFIIFALALGVLLNWNKIRDKLSPHPNLSAERPGDVVLYATAWCGYCKKTRDFFKQHNVAYFEYDIEKSAEGKTKYDELQGRGIPVVVIRGEVVRGYNPTAMQELLEL